MLPWRAIPVTLAHWSEPQIIISFALHPFCRALLLDSVFFFCSLLRLPVYFSPFTVHYPFLRSLFSSPSFQHLPFFYFFIFLFLMLFITIPSCVPLSHSSVFIFSLLLLLLHSSPNALRLTPQQNERPHLSKKNLKHHVIFQEYFFVSEKNSHQHLMPA